MKYKLTNFAEIDKFAIQSYCRMHNIDEAKNIGDVSIVDTKKIEDFNFLVGGSPCQDYSAAGEKKGALYTCLDCGHKYNPLEQHWDKRDKCPKCSSKNIQVTRSSLIVHYLRFLREKKPKIAIYENVKNLQNKAFRPQFDLFLKEIEEYGYNFYWAVLNAKNFGVPQNRERIYVVIIRKDVDNCKFKMPTGFSKDVSIEDILEENIDDIYYLKEEQTRNLIQNLINSDKLEASYQKDNEIHIVGLVDIHGIEQIRRVYDVGGIAPTIDTMQGGHREPKILDKTIVTKNLPLCVASRGRYAIDENNNKVVVQNLEINTNKISNTLTSVEKDNYILESKNEGYTPWIVKKYKQFYDKHHYIPKFFNPYALKEIKDIAPCQTAHCGTFGTTASVVILEEHQQVIMEDICKHLNISYKIRKITPLEAFRLMGFTDADFEKVRYMTNSEQLEASKTNKKYKKEFDLNGNERYILLSNNQAYKQAGNSIVVNVLVEIYKSLYESNPELFNDIKLCSLFSGIGAFEKALNIALEDIRKEKNKHG